jgi:glycosyltransferase involved in cell wall biosynthesis
MRLVFDITSLTTWIGPPTGIVRTQRELARWARVNRPGMIWAAWDPRIGRHAVVADAYADAFIDGAATMDVWGYPPAGGGRWRKPGWTPDRLYAAFRLRRMAMRRLERIRLGRSRLAGWAKRLQRPLINGRNRRTALNADGSRRAHPTPDLALGPPVAFGPSDVLVCTGNLWADIDVDVVARLRAATGLRFAVACYDVIALLRPAWFKDEDAATMAAFWPACFAAADLVVFNSKAVEADATAVCRAAGISLARTAITPLGANPARMLAAEGGPGHGLQDGRYALFVSTIEPRKGHEMLYRAWLQLLAQGVPQRHTFKLVFVGRFGWRMEALQAALAADARLADSLVVLSGVDDAELDGLYRGAAFCLYPSQYEGYGLPVVEAFARGKAVLVSDAGSLPEVTGSFSPLLPAGDEDAWRNGLRAWIEDPLARAPFETAIRERFAHPSWDAAAERFFACVDAAFSAPAAQPAIAENFG